MASHEPEHDERLSSGAGAGGPVRYCAVYNCLNNYKTQPNLSYFMIPPEEDRCKIWLERIQRLDIKPRGSGRVSGYYRVCEAHFDPRCISSNPLRRRLSRRALPSRLLPPRAPPAPPATARVRGRLLARSTPEVFEFIDRTPESVNKRSETAKYEVPPAPAVPAAPAALAAFFGACDQHLNNKLAEFVKLLTHMQQKAEGEGDSDSLNRFCLKLCVASPTAYRLLRPALGLPRAAALRGGTPLVLDFDSKLIDLLKLRVNRMTEKEKHCTLGVDFINVRPHLYYNITSDRIIGLQDINGAQTPWPATRCAVLTARALLARWAQPVAVACLGRAAQLVDWLERVVRELLALGLVVHALVSDPSALAAKHPDVSPEHPFFLVDGQKIYQLYDPPRLMKLLLCNFALYDLHFERTVAKWSDLVEYYEMEKHNSLTSTPRLAAALAHAAAPRRMRPAQAARVLDCTLAAALAGHAARGLLGDGSRATVNFILKINNLYDLLSSTTITGVEFKKGLSADAEQIGFLTYMKSFFKALVLKDRTGGVGSKDLADSWQVTIAAVLALREDLEPAQPNLLTRRLHLDDRVARAARRLARGNKPTCVQVQKAFRKHFLDDLLRPTGEERDVDMASLFRVGYDPTLRGRLNLYTEQGPAVRASDYRRLRLPRRGTARAAAACVLGAARRVHGACARAARYCLAAPSARLLRLLAQLERALADALRAPAPRLLADLLLDLHVLDLDEPCDCFPLEFIKKLYLRLRLYHILKDYRLKCKKGFIVKLYIKERPH